MLTISSNEVTRSLAFDNPWWEGGLEATPEVHKLRRFYFDTFEELALNWDVRRSVILMGPRRVGKTVMLQQFIRDLLINAFDPKAILFASVDTPVYSGLRLDQIIDLYEQDTGIDKNARRVIIFDEIQYLKDWEVSLKVLTDRYPNTRFIASGSAAAALKLKSQESGAGRFTDFILPPLTFAEFIDFRGKADLMVVADVSDAEGTKNDKAQPYTNDIEALNAEFQLYLNFGGYPEAVLNPEIQKNVQRYLGRDIIDKVLLRDLPTLYGIQDVQELNRLFTVLAYHTGQEISYDKLSQSSGVAKNTIKKYLEYLQAAFLIMIVKRVDQNGKTFKRMVNFKVYLTNPSMRAALFGPIDSDHEAMGAVVETAIFSQWFHSPIIDDLYYARWKKGQQDYEVDIVCLASSFKPVWAVEIKWSDRYVTHVREMKGLVEFIKNNPELRSVRATTKTETLDEQLLFDSVNIDLNPSAEYCYILGRNTSASRSRHQADLGLTD